MPVAPNPLFDFLRIGWRIFSMQQKPFLQFQYSIERLINPLLRYLPLFNGMNERLHRLYRGGLLAATDQKKVATGLNGQYGGFGNRPFFNPFISRSSLTTIPENPIACRRIDDRIFFDNVAG